MVVLLPILLFQAVAANLDAVKWTHGANDPAGSESVVLREDARTGGLELLARYPAGHVFKPHWHESNERVLLIEGRLSIGADRVLEPGGFAYLPARELQQMACVSQTRCTFVSAGAKIPIVPNEKLPTPDKG
jgi:hypothetical protein